MGVAILNINKDKSDKSFTGFADAENKVPITASTTFELASVSKQFTAKAIMLLQSRKQLSFEDRLGKYFPQLSNAVTIRHMLWHTSGLPEYTTYLDWNSSVLTNQDVIEGVVNQKMTFSPGDKWEYCNSNYALLSTIVEKVASQPFPNFMKNELFSPLGMKSTQVLQPYAGYARGYQGDYINESPNLIYGDGGVWSNLEDMELWIKSLDTDSEMFVQGTLNSGSSINYGFGMDISADCFSHGGLWAGYHNLVYISREDTSVRSVVLSNDCNTDTWSILGKVEPS